MSEGKRSHHIRPVSLLTAAALLGLTAATSIAPASASPSRAPTKVSVWDIQTGIDQTLLKQQAATFNRTHPNISVAYDWYQNDPYKTKLTLALGAHHGPDIFMGWGGGVLDSYVKSGAVYDLTSAFKSDPAWKNRYIPSVMSAVTFGGHIYGVPYNETQPEVVVYNKVVFSRYHITIPSTWPQFLNVIKTLQSHNVIPLAMAGKSIWPEMIPLQYLAERIGGPNPLRQAALNKGGSFNTPVWVKAATMTQQLVKMNAFESGFSSFNYDTGDASQLLYAGRAAMMFMGAWQFGVAQTQSPQNAKNLDFFPFPTVPGGKGTIHDIVGNPANYYSISSSSKNKAAAITYLKQALNPTFVKGLMKAGSLPPVRNVNTSGVNNSILKKEVALLKSTRAFQQAADQLMPPELAQNFLDLISSLYIQSITPGQFAKQMQAKASSYFASHR